MTTREVIASYFNALRTQGDWAEHFADGMEFVNHAYPVSEVTGRDAFVESTKGFYGMIESIEIRSLIVEGDTACALTTYQLQPPVGDGFSSDVAEIFTINGDEIRTFAIYFDTMPFPS